MASATTFFANVSCPAIAPACSTKQGGGKSTYALIQTSGRRHLRPSSLIQVPFAPLSLPASRTPTTPHRRRVFAQSTTGVATRQGASTKLQEKKSTLPEERLIELAKKVLDSNNGLDDPSLLADDFYFAAPVIFLQKKEFLRATGGFALRDAFPDLEPNAYNFFVDQYEPNRVWFFTRTRGTHTGVLNFGAPVQPTYKRVESPPEVSSITFNNEGKATRLTAGYVVDRRMGNTGGLGALFGILYAIGAAPPVPEFQPYERSWQFSIFSNIQGLLSNFVK